MRREYLKIIRVRSQGLAEAPLECSLKNAVSSRGDIVIVLAGPAINFAQALADDFVALGRGAVKLQASKPESAAESATCPVLGLKSIVAVVGRG